MKYNSDVADYENKRLCTPSLCLWLEILGGAFLNWLRVFLLFTNMSLKCEHETDEVSTWAKLDCCIHKQFPFMCKSKEFVVV